MKPTLLFITPTFPSISGHGGAIRAGVFAEALAQSYDIALVVINLWNRNQSVDPLLKVDFKSVYDVSIAQLETLRRIGKGIPVHEKNVQHIHVFRLQMAIFVKSHLNLPLGVRPYLTLDLDDYESELNRRMASLCSTSKDARRGTMLSMRAVRTESMESLYLRRFDQVYVCHEADRKAVSRSYEINNIHVVPNSVRLPSTMRVKSPQTSAVLLFVGTLDYFPNENGITWFCSDIIPIIRQESQMPFDVVIVGSRPSARVIDLETIYEGVRVIRDVPRVTEYYDASMISIVPLRSGGGTRIKILEAMSHRRPVVTTSIGAEGLKVVRDKHLLIGDTEIEFAKQCLRLMNDQSLRDSVAASGYQWVKSHHLIHHSTAVIQSLIAAKWNSVPRPAAYDIASIDNQE